MSGTGAFFVVGCIIGAALIALPQLLLLLATVQAITSQVSP